MTVFLQNARSVLRVSHGTVPGPAGGGPNGAPARRLWPTSSMLPVCGRCGSRGGSCAPLDAAVMKVRATAASIDSANRWLERIGGLLPVGRCRAAWRASDKSTSNGVPNKLASGVIVGRSGWTCIRDTFATGVAGYSPNGDGELQREFVEQWRNNAYGCYSSGHKFCREVCPVMQVTRNENHTPTAFHAHIVAMEKGVISVEDVADDFVHCTQCGACELRCPNTLFTGDFYRHRTRTVDVVKAMRALMVATGNEREGWKLWNERLAQAHNEPVLGEVPVSQEHVRDWAEGLELPTGGETILFVDCEAAFYRTSYSRAFALLLKKAGVEFGLMREQWCCGGPAAGMGYAGLAPKHAEHNVADLRGGGAGGPTRPRPPPSNSSP